MRRQWCDNMNHRRDDAPVRFCPKCGEVANIIVKQCSVEEHAESRMNRNKHCVHCGLQLIK
jgi:ribosomal protein S27AE